jgi:hypothetical protein
MGLKHATNKLDEADGFLTKLKTLLKKHWGILLICLLGFGVYEFIVIFRDEVKTPKVVKPVVDKKEVIDEEVTKHKAKKYVITKKTYIIDGGGYRKDDTIYVDYYDDGFVDMYYTDGETYYER